MLSTHIITSATKGLLIALNYAYLLNMSRNTGTRELPGEIRFAVIDMNLTWQAVTIVPQLNGLRVQRGKNFTGQAG